MSDKKKATVILPDGTEISQEDFDKMDDRHYWSKEAKKTKLGQKGK